MAINIEDTKEFNLCKYRIGIELKSIRITKEGLEEEQAYLKILEERLDDMLFAREIASKNSNIISIKEYRNLLIDIKSTELEISRKKNVINNLQTVINEHQSNLDRLNTELDLLVYQNRRGVLLRLRRI